MNFSTKTKSEIIKRDFASKCCKTALISGFLRTAGSIETHGGVLGFSAISEAKILRFIAKHIKLLYGVESQIILDGEKEHRGSLLVVDQKCLAVLIDAKILQRNDDGVSLRMDIDESFTKKDCCRNAFIVGAFLGSGTVTVPKVDEDKATSYHLEFVFSKKVTAQDFSHLFSSVGFMPKLIKRKETYVVYLKNAEAVNDALTFLGAISTSLELTDIIMQRGIKNDINRRFNCEMYNMDKSVDATFNDREYIQIIKDTIGLDKLNDGLKMVAIARLNSDLSLSALANELKISKSCLSHRLRKLKEIALDLND